MKKRTDSEIIAKLQELWPGTYGSENACLNYIERGVSRVGDSVVLTITDMYQAPGLKFEQIHALAEFFDTMNVEIGTEVFEVGCETCDYGSKYGFTLHVRPGDKFTRISA